MSDDIRNVIIPDDLDILRNRGYQLRVCKLAVDAAGQPKTPWTRESDANGVNQTELCWFRLTNYEFAMIEAPAPAGFGSLENFAEALQETPYQAVTKMYAISQDKWTTNDEGRSVPDIRYAATRLMDGELMSYVTIMMSANLLAQGIRPESVGELMRRQLASIKEKMAGAEKSMAKLDVSDDNDTPTSPSSDSPFSSGSETGSEQNEALTSSGD